MQTLLPKRRTKPPSSKGSVCQLHRRVQGHLSVYLTTKWMKTQEQVSELWIRYLDEPTVKPGWVERPTRAASGGEK
eukprot:696634-Amphidinium_carterae.1